MSIAQLRATARYVHATLLKHGWDNAQSMLPRFYVLTDRPNGMTNRYEATLLPLPQAVWDKARSPADVIAAMDPQRTIWHQTYRGLMFSMEGWSIRPAGDKPEDVERMLAIGEARKIAAQPDRISVRSTTTMGRDDEFVFVFTDEGAPGSMVMDSEANEYDVHQMTIGSAVPLALRRVNDRIMSLMDSQ